MPWIPPPPAPACPTCDQRVYAAEKVVGPGGVAYHPACLICSICRRRLDSRTLSEHQGRLLCAHCHRAHLGTGNGHFNTAVPLRPTLPDKRAGMGTSNPSTPTSPSSAASLSKATEELSLQPAKQDILRSVGLSSAETTAAPALPARPSTLRSPSSAGNSTAGANAAEALSLDDVVAAGTMPRIVPRSQLASASGSVSTPPHAAPTLPERPKPSPSPSPSPSANPSAGLSHVRNGEVTSKPSLPPRPIKPAAKPQLPVGSPAPGSSPASTPAPPPRPAVKPVSEENASLAGEQRSSSSTPAQVDAEAEDQELSAAELIARVRAGRAAGSFVPPSESEEKAPRSSASTVAATAAAAVPTLPYRTFPPTATDPISGLNPETDPSSSPVPRTQTAQAPQVPPKPAVGAGGLPAPRRADPTALRRAATPARGGAGGGGSGPGTPSVASPPPLSAPLSSPTGLFGRGSKVASAVAQATTATPRCARCEKPVYHAEHVTSAGRTWHRACLRCDICRSTLPPGNVVPGPVDAQRILVDVGWWGQHGAPGGQEFCNVFDQHCWTKYFGPRNTKVGMSLPAQEYRRS